ncbi:unnamed protein product [Lymnaea stagnalis]|uniref:Secreted protein n=1 Tax=Lymnaea stagnalis TaxID=6523 RepID=A0AAV2IMR8_LYMST
MELLPAIVLIVQGFRFVSGQTCMEIPKCQYDEKKFADAQSQGDMNTICPLLTNTVICKAIALNDCKSNPTYKDSALEPIQQSLDRDNDQRLAICGAVPEDAECEDIIKCSQETPIMQQYAKAGMIAEACGLYERSVQCLRSSIDNCKERKLLRTGFNETQLEKSVDFLKKNCANRKQALGREPHESSQAGNPGVVVVISSALLTAALLFSASHQCQLQL